MTALLLLSSAVLHRLFATVGEVRLNLVAGDNTSMMPPIAIRWSHVHLEEWTPGQKRPYSIRLNLRNQDRSGGKLLTARAEHSLLLR